VVEQLTGLYHFLGDRVPGGLERVPPRPRNVDLLRENGGARVGKVHVGQDLRSSMSRCVQLIGGLERVISPGDRVLLKPNFNSADAYPGSTALDFLVEAVRMLTEAGGRVTIGESAGGIWRPTRRVLDKLGVRDALAGLGVEIVAFDDRPRDWVTVEVGGKYLREATVPRLVYEADKLVYLPCMKTHMYARFTLSLKLAMGIIHPGQRRGFHMRNLERKVAEINLFRQPDLIIMDGRKAFVTGGPATGELVEPGVIMASGDMVAIDVEALRILGAYKAKNKLLPDPYDSPQVETALSHDLGSRHHEVVT